MGSTETDQSLLKLPVIDFAKWGSGSTPEERLSTAKKLSDACHNFGFVFIINHGVSPELLEEAFGWSRRLFDLKYEEKMLAPHPDGPTVHRGYSWPGLEKVSQVISDDLEVGEKLRAVADCKVSTFSRIRDGTDGCLKESYEIGSEENDEQPNVWIPEVVFPGFRKFMTDFYWECSKVSHEILTAIGTGMGLKDPQFLLKFHSGHNNQLRLLHYPPIPAAQLENESSARMPAHSDWGSITMLFQDDCGGLEVENQHHPGEFIKVTPFKHAIVMNIGDLLMRWSNGKPKDLFLAHPDANLAEDYLKSTLHRVTLPPDEDKYTGPDRMTRARYSIPYFVGPDSDAVIECMPECTNENNPVKYGPIVQREYRLMRGKLQYPDKIPQSATASV